MIIAQYYRLNSNAPGPPYNLTKWLEDWYRSKKPSERIGDNRAQETKEEQSFDEDNDQNRFNEERIAFDFTRDKDDTVIDLTQDEENIIVDLTKEEEDIESTRLSTIQAKPKEPDILPSVEEVIIPPKVEREDLRSIDKVAIQEKPRVPEDLMSEEEFRQELGPLPRAIRAHRVDAWIRKGGNKTMRRELIEYPIPIQYEVRGSQYIEME